MNLVHSERIRLRVGTQNMVQARFALCVGAVPSWNSSNGEWVAMHFNCRWCTEYSISVGIHVLVFPVLWEVDSHDKLTHSVSMFLLIYLLYLQFCLFQVLHFLWNVYLLQISWPFNYWMICNREVIQDQRKKMSLPNFSDIPGASSLLRTQLIVKSDILQLFLAVILSYVYILNVLLNFCYIFLW